MSASDERHPELAHPITLHRIAPIFAVHDLDAAMRHYRRLGFTVRAYSGGGYGFAYRDGVEIHLGVVSGDDRCSGSAYLFVDDADAVTQSWRAAGVEVHEPQDTPWGQHEGSVVDPDGNVIRFGSPISPATPAGAASGSNSPDAVGQQSDLRWAVMRQDDNGNIYQVARHDRREAAEEQMARLSAGQHKQLYWIADLSRTT